MKLGSELRLLGKFVVGLQRKHTADFRKTLLESEGMIEKEWAWISHFCAFSFPFLGFRFWGFIFELIDLNVAAAAAIFSLILIFNKIKKIHSSEE